MRWMFNILDKRVAANDRKELVEFLELISSASNSEVAEIVVYATHIRHMLEESGNYVLDPFTLFLEKPAVLSMLIKAIQFYQSENNHNAAVSFMIWFHSIRAVSRNELRPLGQELWIQLSRGFPHITQARKEICQITGLQIDISDATKIPLGLTANSGA